LQHIDIINIIMSAEKDAKRMADESRRDLENLDAALSAEYEAMRNDYLCRAEKRINSVIESEKKYAHELLAKMDEELRAAIKASEESASANSEVWAEKMFEKVISFPELPL